MWPDTRLLDLLKTELPLIQAPMAGCNGAELAAAVASAGGLGSLPCAMLGSDEIRTEFTRLREATPNPINLNFFCHRPPRRDPQRTAAWRAALAPYYEELGLDQPVPDDSPGRRPFDATCCDVVEELRPEVVSFHFGLPAAELLERIRAAGCRILSTATTVAEACWLVERGVDAIIAQGCEAGGHRGFFLTGEVASQAGTLALVPQIVDAVTVPVIAAGGIGDGRGIAAAFALGAAGVQMGSVYLRCPEARTTRLHQQALRRARDDNTALTNLFSGGPARGIVNRLMSELGPINPEAPAFPLAAAELAPLRAIAEAQGSTDFSPLWAGQAAALAREQPAASLTRELARQALEVLGRLGPTPVTRN